MKPPGELTIIRLPAGSPPIWNQVDSFYAKKGEDRELRIYFEDTVGGPGEEYLRLRVDSPSLLSYPDGTLFQVGDSVLITVRVVDPEQIYFEFAKACGGALCVVGDDDQSLYRFRGATVDLFRNFRSRYRERFGRSPKDIYLTTNFRSTQSIVKFVNSYATLDKGYQTVRVAGKPKLGWGPRAAEGRPVLGMFRDSREDLAADLAAFIHAVFRGRGYSAPGIEKIR